MYHVIYDDEQIATRDNFKDAISHCINLANRGWFSGDEGSVSLRHLDERHKIASWDDDRMYINEKYLHYFDRKDA